MGPITEDDNHSLNRSGAALYSTALIAAAGSSAVSYEHNTPVANTGEGDQRSGSQLQIGEEVSALLHDWRVPSTTHRKRALLHLCIGAYTCVQSWSLQWLQ